MAPYFLQRLELDNTADERAIRRAYARELKKIDQETDAAGFQALREVYEAALNWIQRPKEAEPTVETVAPDDGVRPSYAPPKIVPRFRLNDATLVVRPEQTEEEADAAEAFNRFMAAYQEAVSTNRSTLDANEWQENLAQCLSSDLLVNIAARDIFERKFAHLIAEGWRPGHEVLFVVAGKVFGWEEDRQHLRALGGVGYVLEKALHERAVFNSIDSDERMQQHALIQRLRNSAAPTQEELTLHRRALEKALRIFPTWLGVITDMNQLQRWHQLAGDLPSNARQAFEINETRLPKQNKSNSPAPFWIVWLLLIGLINGVRACDSKPAPTPVTQTQVDTLRKQIQSTLEPHPMIGAVPLPQGAQTIVSDSRTIGERIRANTMFAVPDNLRDNHPVEYRVSLTATGLVKEIRLIKSSGLPDFDKAVSKAIEKSQPFPPNPDGKIPSEFILSHRPLPAQSGN